MIPHPIHPHGRPAGRWLAALALAAAAWLAGCTRQPAPPAAEQTLRVSQLNEPATLDPQLATLPDEFFVLRALSEGLYVPKPDGGVERALAATHDISADGLVHTFHLRPDARWSDGSPVTARDLVFTCRRALTAALGAPKAHLFFPLKNAAPYYRGKLTDFAAVGAAAPDDHTFVLTLEHPRADLPALLASGAWLPLPAALIEQHGGALSRDGAWTKPGVLLGNGPFVLAEWKPSQHLLVRRNPHYRAPDRVRVDAIRFQIYDSGDTEERAFRAGQVDVTMSVPFTKLGTYAPPVLQTQPLAETRFLSFNTRRAPLTDLRVRRALALVLDRRALIDAVLKGGQQLATSFIPPGLGGHQPATHLPAPDIAEAKRLLAAAGFPDGRGFPALEIVTWTNVPLLEVIQQRWRHTLGLEIAIAKREARVHLAGLAAGDYDLALVPTLPDHDSALAVLDPLTADAAENYPQWHEPRFDALVDAAARTADPAARLALQQQAEALLLADLPVVPLYFNTQNYLLSPRVKGWREDGLWNRFYLDVSLTP